MEEMKKLLVGVCRVNALVRSAGSETKSWYTAHVRGGRHIRVERGRWMTEGKDDDNPSRYIEIVRPEGHRKDRIQETVYNTHQSKAVLEAVRCDLHHDGALPARNRVGFDDGEDESSEEEEGKK